MFDVLRVLGAFLAFQEYVYVNVFCFRFSKIMDQMFSMARNAVLGSFSITFTVARVFVDGVSRPGFGAIEDAFSFPLDILYFELI